MPLYDFYCENCGASFEEIVSAQDAAPACPQCGANNVKRQISMPSPLKKGAFPFKPGPVHPIASKMAGGCSGGSCPGGGGCH